MDKRKISIIIIEKNMKVRRELERALNSDKAYNIVIATDDHSRAASLLMSDKADVVLIMAECESLSILKMRSMPGRPIFIVTADPGQQAAVKELLRLGADYSLMKPINMDTVASQIKDVLFFKRMPPYTDYSGHESPGVLEFAVRYLNSVPIGSHLKGYHYLLTGIAALFEDENMKGNITKSLYPYIAKKWHSTPSRVERAMRNAIEIAWNSGKNLKAVTGEGIGRENKPSNSQFMMAVANMYRASRPRKEQRPPALKG